MIFNLSKSSRGQGMDNPGLARAVMPVDYWFRGIHCECSLYVVDSPFPILLGRDWIVALFDCDWMRKLVDVEMVRSVMEKQKQSIRNHQIFGEWLGLVVKYKAALDLKGIIDLGRGSVRPDLLCLLWLSILARNLIGWRILVKVDCLQFASPVVLVVKQDDSLCLCSGLFQEN